MSLTGVAIGAHLEGCFKVPVAVGNDGNLGTLGESWLGSARKAGSALGIWVGTGIGAGFVHGGKLWRGARESAGEIGHIVMQIGGPVCGCGNHGCLEALASRSAIERDIRHAMEAGRSTILTELTGGDLSVIRSGAIRKALKAGRPVGERGDPSRLRGAGLRLSHRASHAGPRSHRARRRAWSRRAAIS